MDSLPEHGRQSWQAITSPTVHYVSFILLVFLEAVAAILCWHGSWKMFQNRQYQQGVSIATSGLTLALVIWFEIFFIIGGEWFLAWQGPWGALPSAIRVVTIVGG